MSNSSSGTATAASRLSRSSVRFLVAGAIVVVGLAVAGGVVWAKSRGDDDTAERRAAITQYIAGVNMTQQELVVELVAVNDSYRDLRLTPAALPKQIERLERAEATLASLRAEVDRLEPPPEARTLHRELVALLDLQVAFAAEVAGMATYLLAEVAEQRKVAAATRSLSKALTDAGTAEGQKAAFGRYARALEGAVATLEEASAPAVLEPSRTGELARLERLVSLSRKLGASLSGGEARKVDDLFRRFAQTTADTGTTKAERQAVVAFNRRLRAIADQRAKVTQERARLDRAVR